MSKIHMTVLAPRRLAQAAALLASVLTLAACGASGSGTGDARTSYSRPCARRLAAVGIRGSFAFIRNGGISILHLPDCRTHVLLAQSDAKAPIQFSGNGRYLAYGDGEVIGAGGTPAPIRPLGALRSWAWSPSGEELAGVGTRGGLAAWRPGGGRRQLIPAGWGATEVAFSPDGKLVAVMRSVAGSGGASSESELWSVSLRTGRRRLAYRSERPGELGAGIAGFTPDGREVLVWPNITGSASLSEDGLPLVAIPLAGGRPRTLVKDMLAYRDYLAICGQSLLVAAGGDRYATSKKSLLRMTPPAYRAIPLRLSRQRSWTSPSCSTTGEMAVSAGASTIETHFGLERRSIWLIPSPGAPPRKLASPGGPDVTDELPRISKDGRYVLYIETRSPPHGGLSSVGSLWALPLKEGGEAPIGPIAQVGVAGNYYGHYGWALVTAWHQG